MAMSAFLSVRNPLPESALLRSDFRRELRRPTQSQCRTALGLPPAADERVEQAEARYGLILRHFVKQFLLPVEVIRVKSRLLLILLAPTLTSALLMTLLVSSAQSEIRSANETSWVADAAERAAELDAALGAEIIAATESEQRENLEASYRQTDQALVELRSFDVEGRLDVGLLATELAIARRSDIESGVASPLQLGDRYSAARTSIRDALGASAAIDNSANSTRSLTYLFELMEAQSAHVDERLAVDLALRYDTWAPGQLAAAVQAINTQSIEVTMEGSVGPPTELVDVRRVLTTTNELPESLTQQTWAEMSDEWFARLDLRITNQVDAVLVEAAEIGGSAATERRSALVVGIGGIILALIVGLNAAMQFVRRLDRIAEATALFAHSPDTEIVINDGGQDNIGQVASAFDGMANKLRTDVRRRHLQVAAMESIAEQQPLERSLAMCDKLVALPGRFVVEDLRLAFVDEAGTHHTAPETLGTDRLDQVLAWDVAETAMRRAADHAELRRQAHRDELTSLLNRAGVLAAIKEACSDPDAIPGVLFIDLDEFKEVNDTFGHERGDVVLRAVARKIEGVADSNGWVAGRLGGDEFVLLAPHESRKLESVAGSIVTATAEVARATGTRVSASIGVSIRKLGTGHEELLAEADAAMYAAKRGGGPNVIVSSDELRSRIADERNREQRLRLVLTKDDLDVHYQPIWSVDGSTLRFMEALVRPGPSFGADNTSTFIQEAVRLGLTYEVDRRVIAMTCRQIAEWQRIGFEPPPICVNLSAQTLSRATLESDLLDLVEMSGCKPSALCLEVTEDSLISDVESVSKRLGALRKLGFSVAVDDFGTGYSSLAYLANLPADLLKIDMSFVTGVDHDATKASIVETVIRLAQSLGMESLAEGVETEPERAYLAQAGCDLVQGYLLGRPAPADQVANLLSTPSSSHSRLHPTEKI